MATNSIIYTSDLNQLSQYNVGNFYDGWETKPSQEVFWDSLKNSYRFICAVDTETKMIVGYITAISDGVLSSYVPFLEVDKRYQGKGIGSTLLKKILKELDGLYMTDLVCDEEKAGFYEKAGMMKWNAMILRRFEHQVGIKRKT